MLGVLFVFHIVDDHAFWEADHNFFLLYFMNVCYVVFKDLARNLNIVKGFGKADYFEVVEEIDKEFTGFKSIFNRLDWVLVYLESFDYFEGLCVKDFYNSHSFCQNDIVLI